MTKVFIGTSGYNYKHWQGKFYPQNLPQRQWLEFYAKHFNTVELNVTFYRLPYENVFKGWYNRTPKNFKFVIKGSRFITHIKRLKDCEDAVELFFKRACYLKDKLAGVLWQMPPSFDYDFGRIRNFLALLKNWPQYLYSFEFRHKSWFNEKMVNLFNKYNVSICFADSPSYPAPEFTTGNFLYFRFHGGKTLYASRYSKEELKEWALKIRRLKKNKKMVLVFFNNDAYGFAVKNALELKKLLSS